MTLINCGIAKEDVELFHAINVKANLILHQNNLGEEEKKLIQKLSLQFGADFPPEVSI